MKHICDTKKGRRDMARWIDGDALIAWIKETQHQTSKMKNVICKIKTMPSEDRSQGKWIRDRYWSRGTGMGEEYGFFYKCSLCEYEVENGYTRCGFNFCPYCGADMRGADHGKMD